jgi:hypothetical protein
LRVKRSKRCGDPGNTQHSEKISGSFALKDAG